MTKRAAPELPPCSVALPAPVASEPPPRSAAAPCDFELPPNSSALTAAPADDLDALPWLELATLPCDLAAAADAFWHVVRQYTFERHWNRTIYHIDVVREVGAFPPRSGRYVALRELLRKTPAPIGGGWHGRKKSTVCHEWAAHCGGAQVATATATFGLVVPASVVTADNPRAMTYWPFHYPKGRAYRYSYAGGTLRYEVVPLAIGGDRPAAEALLYVRKTAAKQLVQLYKRMRAYNPATGLSSYVKRVTHDRLVREADYRRHYNRLRERYAHWVESWNNTEVTDPTKFVYEEMAIAAYLLALWEAERAGEGEGEGVADAKQTFVDAGCGNGFLVYLLMEEGHRGCGYDLRRRRIWARYPQHVQDALHCEAVTPTFNVAPYDWVLGNHSDELTPWLPLLVAGARGQGSGTPRLFVLPCCFFDVDGRKLSFADNRRTVRVPRAGQGIGCYERYVEWIKRICVACGLEVEEENLRIPSTKYRSLICTRVAHAERLQPEVLAQLSRLLTLDAELSRS